MSNPLIPFKKVNEILLDELKNNPDWVMETTTASAPVRGEYTFCLLSLDSGGIKIRVSLDDELEQWRIRIEVNDIPLKYYGGEVGTFCLQLKTMYEETEKLQAALEHLEQRYDGK